MANQSICIDFGNKDMKLVYMRDKSIAKIVTAEIPDGCMNSGEILSPDQLAMLIKSLIKDHSIPKAGVTVLLPSEQVFCKNITSAAMTEKQLRFNLPYEFKDYLTEEKSKYNFDFSMQEVIKNASGKPDKMRYFACTVKSSLITDYATMLKKAGLRLKKAVPQEWAYVPVLQKYIQDKHIENRDFGILDVGQEGTRLLIYHGSEYLMRRNLDLGISKIETIIADHFGLSAQSAHEYLLENRENALECEPVKQFFGKLEIELMKAVNFYNYNNREGSLEDIFVIGGGASFQPLMDAVGKLINICILKGDALIPDCSDIDAPWRYVTAYGIGLE